MNTEKIPCVNKSKGSVIIKANKELKGYSQFIIRNIISDLTILLLLYFGLIENLNKTAKEAVLVEIIEMMLDRESASDVNSAY